MGWRLLFDEGTILLLKACATCITSYYNTEHMLLHSYSVWTQNMYTSSLCYNVYNDQTIYNILCRCRFLHEVTYSMKNTIFWDVTPYIPAKINRWFGGTYWLHNQGQWVTQIIRAHACSLLLVRYLILPKCWQSSTGLHSSTPQKMKLLLRESEIWNTYSSLHGSYLGLFEQSYAWPPPNLSLSYFLRMASLCPVPCFLHSVYRCVVIGERNFECHMKIADRR
jgi:hypothetical protein